MTTLQTDDGAQAVPQPYHAANAEHQAPEWRRLLGYLQPYRLRMALALVALAVQSGLALASPLLIGRALELALPANLADQQLANAQLTALVGGLIALYLVQALFTFVQSYQIQYVGERIVLDLRAQLYQHLHALSLDFYADRRVGELISRLIGDVTLVRATLTTNVSQVLSQLIGLVGAVVIVFVLNPRLTLFVVVVGALLALAARSSGRLFEDASTRVQDAQAGATVAAEEALQGVRVVKSFTREHFEVARYGQAAWATFEAARQLTLVRGLVQAVMTFIGFSAIAALVWFGGREVIAGRIKVSDLTVFLIYGVTIAGSMGGLSGVYSSFREAIGAVRRVFEILDTPPQVRDAPGAAVLPAVMGQIAIQQVSFSYDTRQPVLADINLEIAPGQIVALVGPSGAGKSTLFNLLPRFYDPTAGAITIDGVDLRAVTQQSLRSQIGLVPQETLLFGGSIRQNIAYGRLDASAAEIEEAARAANADAFIRALPDGYDTQVGERGVKLSGGQRQRIAIARALLKDPRILLLDEATSALDSESEELVQEALNRLMQGRTTLVIAHRLSTIKLAHLIVVLEGGRIVERGSHAELMALDRLYARLYRMQFRSE